MAFSALNRFRRRAPAKAHPAEPGAPAPTGVRWEPGLPETAKSARPRIAKPVPPSLNHVARRAPPKAGPGKSVDYISVLLFVMILISLYTFVL
jgi:hypothetical protein